MKVKKRKTQQRRVIIAGGGTGGHIYPGIAVAKKLLEKDPKLRILFVGSRASLDRRILAREGIPHRSLYVSGLARKSTADRLKGLLFLPLAMIQSLWLLMIFRPHLSFGVGGYASGPLILLAALLGFPTMIQEQNVYPGATNRILSRFARISAVSFEETRRYLKGKTVVTGNPVRPGFYRIKRGIKEKGRFHLLIFGGSQGARIINKNMVEALAYLKDYRSLIQIVHQTGEREHQNVAEAYQRMGFKARIEPYIYDIIPHYDQADLVVCRSGATTIAELTAAGKASVLIPIAVSAGEHQLRNARSLASSGAAIVIEEKELSGRLLAEQIISLMKNPTRLQQMEHNSHQSGQKEAAEVIARLALELMGNESIPNSSGKEI